MGESVPVAGAEVEVRLRAKGGKTTTLYQGKTRKDGSAEPQFKVPDLPSGPYTLEVVTPGSRARALWGQAKVGAEAGARK
jgi:hypothetical protein